ncbi:MAG: class II fructose-bisphosphate aldolase [Clostridiaceae bacterium]|nr:class II fructose-bisphosphate aldolase [Clostridiaceae bacterium]
MAIITDRKEVLGIYNEANRNRWVLPCFCSENLTTTEAILAAAKEYGDENGIEDLPVIVAITCQYDHRKQSSYYSLTRRWDIGLKLFLEDLKVLTDKGSPYEKLRVMIHLDHIQFDNDKELLSWDMGAFSSIMFDASKLAFDENIKLTREFVREQGNKIVIEGACDEIMDALGRVKSEITTPKKAEKYFNETNVDLIVVNLGTEHRASGKDLKYYSDQARKIKEKVSTRIVLHGASSLQDDQIANLFDDGICKVNLWTVLERDSAPDLFEAMVLNGSKVAGKDTIERLKKQELLGPKCISDEKPSVDFFTTAYRQNIVYNKMKKIIGFYMKLLYVC